MIAMINTMEIKYVVKDKEDAYKICHDLNKRDCNDETKYNEKYNKAEKDKETAQNNMLENLLLKEAKINALIVGKLKNGNVYNFDGDDNCAYACDGWDGVSKRCQCGNRHVRWKLNADGDNVKPEAC